WPIISFRRCGAHDTEYEFRHNFNYMLTLGWRIGSIPTVCIGQHSGYRTCCNGAVGNVELPFFDASSDQLPDACVDFAALYLDSSPVSLRQISNFSAINSQVSAMVQYDVNHLSSKKSYFF